MPVIQASPAFHPQMSSSASRVGVTGALGPRKRGEKVTPFQWRSTLPLPATQASLASGPHTPVSVWGTPVRTSDQLSPSKW